MGYLRQQVIDRCVLDNSTRNTRNSDKSFTIVTKEICMNMLYLKLEQISNQCLYKYKQTSWNWTGDKWRRIIYNLKGNNQD